MSLHSLVIALWYGFIWGLKSPVHAYKAGETYGRVIAWVCGLSALFVYPLSVFLGTAKATIRYYLSGGPEG